jgi:hypothetical protein
MRDRRAHSASRVAPRQPHDPFEVFTAMPEPAPTLRDIRKACELGPSRGAALDELLRVLCAGSSASGTGRSQAELGK